jgi:hypothetical protein
LETKNAALANAAARDRTALQAMRTRVEMVRFFGGPIDGWTQQPSQPFPSTIKVDKEGEEAVYHLVKLPCGHCAYSVIPPVLGEE